MSGLPRFIHIHSLHVYTGVLLNRDDSGGSKRLTLGGYVRTRISSQCLKRHWRVAGGEGMGLAELGHEATRTRRFERKVEEKLALSHPDMPEELRKVALEGVAVALYGDKAADTRKRQALLFGDLELSHIADVVARLVDGAKSAKEVKDRAKAELSERRNVWKAMTEAVQVKGGIPGALFGRMVTADPASNLDAAIHVAHAFTVHEEETEGDALTVVDDLTRDDETGSGGMFDTEINSGCFYGSVVIDVAQLVENACGVPAAEFDRDGVDRELAAAIVERLVHLIARVSPGAKKGSTSPYGHVEGMMVELGDGQPRSLAAAFHEPVRLGGNRSAAMKAADRIADRIERTDKLFGETPRRMYVAVDESAAMGGTRAETLDELAAFAASALRGVAVREAA